MLFSSRTVAWGLPTVETGPSEEARGKGERVAIWV